VEDALEEYDDEHGDDNGQTQQERILTMLDQMDSVRTHAFTSIDYRAKLRRWMRVMFAVWLAHSTRR
jgi:hypothetical protein